MTVPPTRGERVGRKSETALGVDIGDRRTCRSTGLDGFGSPQAEDVSVGALDFLAHHDFDIPVGGVVCGFERTFDRVVVADRYGAEIGVRDRPVHHLTRCGCPVRCGGVYVYVGGGEGSSHGCIVPDKVGWGYASRVDVTHMSHGDAVCFEPDMIGPIPRHLDVRGSEGYARCARTTSTTIFRAD